MQICILAGSPRKHGNTAALLKPFMETLDRHGADADLYWLYEKDIRPCTACCTCQNYHAGFGCIQHDDMADIFDAVLSADLILLATPIYSWYCPAPLKAALDRLVYGMNKYYGDERGGSLWKGKQCAILATCGYPPDQGADLFEEGIKRYCRHSHLEYAGMCAAQDPGYRAVFMTEDKREMAQAFALRLLPSST